MKQAAKAGIVVAGVVAVGLAGAITFNATQTASHADAGAPPSATASAAPSATGSAKAPSAGAAANPSVSAAPSSQAATPAASAPGSAKPDVPVTPASAAPVPAVPAPAAPGLDASGVQRIENACTARLQSDASHSSIVTGTVVPRPFTIVSVAFSGTPARSTAASGKASYDVLMKITTKLVDGPSQDGVRVCRVYDSDSRVDWIPAG
ncbi:hypothetical protein GCM10023063_41730 [Arthrobacter methylotrophus]|uniref:Uncharacterized protein n=1 Tax=Arthrobacter methylotrophus TaxID=121291 RepID=A0ABV5UQ93_9MICC